MTHHQCGEMVETLKSKSFQGARKKIDTKILHHPGLYPQFFLPAAPFFIFCSAKKGSLEAKFLHRTQTFLPAAPYILFFCSAKKEVQTPHHSSAEALVPRVIEPQRALHWHAHGYHEGAYVQVQNHCPIQIIFPTSLGIPLHFAAKMQLDQSCKKFRARVARGFGTPF